VRFSSRRAVVYPSRYWLTAPCLILCLTIYLPMVSDGRGEVTSSNIPAVCADTDDTDEDAPEQSVAPGVKSTTATDGVGGSAPIDDISPSRHNEAVTRSSVTLRGPPTDRFSRVRPDITIFLNSFLAALPPFSSFSSNRLGTGVTQCDDSSVRSPPVSLCSRPASLVELSDREAVTTEANMASVSGNRLISLIGLLLVAGFAVITPDSSFGQ
jgi:hypothetical protein